MRFRRPLLIIACVNELVSYKGDLLPAADAPLAAASAAALYGRGIFTTIAIIKSKPFVWEKHWRRLMDNSTKTGLDTSQISQNGLRNELNGLLEAKGISDGRARITLFDASPTDLWAFSIARKTSVLILAAKRRVVPENLRLGVSPFRINSASPLAAVKSCNYLEKILAVEEARTRGFDEAIQLNERGHITSACVANVFWVSDGSLFTPSLDTGCQPGTTREFVLENLECREFEAGPEVLQNADAIFLTSAGLGVVRVDVFDGRKLGGEDHPILGLIPVAFTP